MKKIREAPQDMKALWKVIMTNWKDMKESGLNLWYQDETEDWITIADDDDLIMAYETAQGHFKGNLKIFVKPSK